MFTQTPLNVVELLTQSLLGGSNLVNGDMPVSSGESVESGQFDMILNSMLGSKNINVKSGLFENINNSNNPLSNDKNSVFPNLIENLLVNPEGITSESGIADVEEGSLLTQYVDSDGVITIDKDSEAIIDEKTGKSNTGVIFDFVKIVNPNLYNSINSKTVDANKVDSGLIQNLNSLPEGDYRVVNAEIVDGSLQISVVSENSKDGELIKLNLPLEMLSELKSNGNLNRVELSDNKSLLEKQTEIFDKVNIKEITIKTVNENENSKSVEITLTADQNGISKQSKLIQQTQSGLESELAEGSENKKKNIINTDSGKQIAVEDIEVETETKDGKSIKTVNSIVDQNNQLNKDKMFRSGLIEPTVKASGNNSHSSNSSQNSVDMNWGVSSSSSLEQSVQNTKVELAQVKFSLPDNIQQNLIPNSKAVFIKIHPENLGPAKLSLSIHDDKLRARLVVNSPIAKEVVEGSLDRLVDQLSKVNIKVDLIDVSVAGDSSENELFNQQMAHHQRASMKSLNLRNGDLNDESIAATKINVPLGEYVSQSGVNLYA